MTAHACSAYHSEPPDLGDMAWHSDADRRHKRGEKQRRCPACLKWVWEEFFKADAPRQYMRHMGGGHYRTCGPDEPGAREIPIERG